MNNRFTNKIALITGSAKGIGKATAEIMANEGATVILTDIDKESLYNTYKEFIDKGYKANKILVDLSKREGVDLLINEVEDKFGRIDILVNNAGVLLSSTIENTTDKMIDLTIDINLKAVLYAIRAVTPIMKKQKYGRIVNLASITGKRGDNSTTFVYGSTKGAVITMTRSVARQLGPWGITCNAIAPHAVMTEMMSYWTEEKKQTMAEKIPVKRLGTVEEMAQLISYLASDQAGFITGETININGGYYMD
ncbi:MAG: SDR family NAD(P)-dependent oxidoreductase [Pleomorphochaeta sp.]